MINATQPGVGKSLLVSVAHLIASGRASTSSPVGRDEEMEKRITATLVDAQTLLALDNFEGVVDSPVLAEVATSTDWLGRRLGASEMVVAPNRLVISITGNGLGVGRDIPRRCVWITLHAERYDPEARQFKRPDLRDWTLAHRAEIVTSLLTMVIAWQHAGRPSAPDQPTIGSFQQWADFCAGVLAHAGIHGFLDNAQEARALSNSDDGKWAALLDVAESHFIAKHGWFSTAEFNAQIPTALQALGGDAPEIPKDLAYAMSPDDTTVANTRVGLAFKRNLGRRFDHTGIRLDSQLDPGKRTQRWRVIRDHPRIS
jgi:hypothetical protein